jgi:hypothetical protein
VLLLLLLLLLLILFLQVDNLQEPQQLDGGHLCR